MHGKSGNKNKVVMATLILVICTLGFSTPVMSRGGKKRRGFISLGIYWNQEVTDTVSSIDWGTLEQSSNKSVTVYIKNEGKKVVSLSFSTSNWHPSHASDHISLNWDYNGQFINTGEVVKVTFTLSMTKNIKETFSFDVIIAASR